MTDYNLPPYANPCCGYVSSGASDMEDPEKVPEIGDIAICLNCGSLLAYIDPTKNRTRCATHKDIALLSEETKYQLLVLKRYIQKRGWLLTYLKQRSKN